MFFLIIATIVWAVYTFIMKRRLKKNFRLYKSLLPLLLFSIIISIGLGITWLATMVPRVHEGISIHNFIGYWVIKDDNWSLNLFKNYFEYSQVISIVLLAVYSVLRIVEDK